MQGYTISGNDIEIDARRDYEQGTFGKCWYWSEITITMNSHEMDFDDLTERNKELILDQLPPL